MRPLPLSCVFLSLLPSLALGAPGAPAPRAAQHFDVQRRLDVNNLNLFVTNFGNVGSDVMTAGPGLLFPRGTANGVLYAGGLWLGATVGGETRVAVAEYSSEFGPGVIAGGVPEPAGLPDIVVWKVLPWTGNPADTTHVDRTPAELAADPTMDDVAHHSWAEYMANAAPRGAPVRTWTLPGPGGVGSVNVLGPDVSGDQMLWCVFNDADPALHQASPGHTLPLGVEVQQSVFGFNRMGPLGQTAFVHWRIVNKSAQTLDATRAGFWLDPDLGGFADDLTGCDSTRSLGFAYNATNADLVYGSSPPALGVDLFDIPPGAPGGPQRGAASFTSYINGTDPTSSTATANALAGLASGGFTMINPVTGLPTTFAFSGDPVTQDGWVDQGPTDKRMLIARAPITLAPGQGIDVWAALIVVQDSDRLSSVSKLKCWDDGIQGAFDLGLPPGTFVPSVCSGPTAALASLVSASALPDRAELEWDVFGAVAVSVQRAVPDESWQTLGEAPVGGTGRVSWEDTGVTAGARYGYRLALGAGGTAPFAGEAWVEVPLSARLAIAGFSPNPGAGPTAIRFSLAGHGHAVVQLLDMAGRRVFSRDVTAFGPGTHAVPLGAALAPGIYWLRLTQGGQSVTAKGILLR